MGDMDILLPEGSRPSNLHMIPWQLDEHGIPIISQARLVTHDMFMICERIKEISPRLYLMELERTSREGTKFGYAIMENCEDGVQRVYRRVTKEQLDGRLLEQLRYDMALTLQERIEKIDREIASWEADQAEDEREKLWEQIGGPMQIELERNGFIDGRGVSHRKLNRTARRAMQYSGRRSVMGLAPDPRILT